jgi:hypothetical protein
MALGWVVVKFSRNQRAQEVAWFEEKHEAIEEADLLNTTEEIDTWYGWEKNK